MSFTVRTQVAGCVPVTVAAASFDDAWLTAGWGLLEGWVYAPERAVRVDLAPTPSKQSLPAGENA